MNLKGLLFLVKEVVVVEVVLVLHLADVVCISVLSPLLFDGLGPIQFTSLKSKISRTW